jgi:hypothetical protein
MATVFSTQPKRRTGETKKVARNAVTGMFVLAPATKGATITIAKARLAANTVHGLKK